MRAVAFTFTGGVATPAMKFSIPPPLAFCGVLPVPGAPPIARLSISVL